MEENAVAVIEPVTHKVIRTVVVGAVPIQLYATPDSLRLLVANQGTRRKPGNTVRMIYLESLKVAKKVVIGAGAHGVVVDRGARRSRGQVLSAVYWRNLDYFAG